MNVSEKDACMSCMSIHAMFESIVCLVFLKSTLPIYPLATLWQELPMI